MKSRSLIIVLSIGLLLLIGRLMLPSVLLRYVNQTLNGIPDYQAKIRSIDVSLWRGAYVIHDLRMIKKGGQEKFPFVNAPQIDLAIQWLALFEGKVVGVIQLKDPTMNFVQSGSQEKSQLSGGAGWEEQGKKLFPFQINQLVIENGTMTFRELEVPQESDLHLTAVHVKLTGITNVGNTRQSLPAHLEIQATVFDTGSLKIGGAAELMRDPVSFDINTSLEEVDLTKLNPYVKHHAGFSFKSGSFALYSNLRANKGEVQGYVKPIFDHIGIIDLKDAGNPFAFVWESVAAAFVEVFTNHSKDQFATVIPLSGNLNDPKADIWSTLVNLVRNAFIQAFKPGFEKSTGQPVTLEDRLADRDFPMS